MRQDVYRAAFDEAKAELDEIQNKFEQLRQRKERIEKVVEMLKPMADTGEGMIAEPLTPRVVEEVPASEELQEPEVPEMATVGAREESESMSRGSESSSDPFQRRIDSALGLRDAREFGRRFTGTLQRR